MKPLIRAGLLLPALLAMASGCEDDSTFVNVFQIDAMSQVIGGPAASARPGDYLLENNRLRAVIHGRHNKRSTFPIANGSLVDLDIQRPPGDGLVGQGKDTFYELGPMVNLKINSSREMKYGKCDEVGSAPCPKEGCVRVTATGPGENVMSLLSLLDLAIMRQSFDGAKLVMTNDYDVCPDEPLVRVTTTAKFEDNPTKVADMEELPGKTGLMDVLLGEHTGVSCEDDKGCKAGETCAQLLLEVPLGGFTIKMRRCRTATNKLAGTLAGDLALFSAKVNIFVPGGGFDHESYIRSVFDAGGDTFSNPLTASFMAAVSDGVSYTYFNETGVSNIPVFTEAFTATFTNRFACDRNDKDCFKGKSIRFKRFVGVGQGDVASAMEGFYTVRKMATSQVEGHVLNARDRKPLSGVDVFAYKVPAAWRNLTTDELANKCKDTTYEALEALHRKESATTQNPSGEQGVVSQFKTDVGLDRVPDGSFTGRLAMSSEWCDTKNCRYILLARPHGRVPSQLLPVTVTAGGSIRVTLMVGDTATLQYAVTDQGGRFLPSKISVGRCFPECAVNANCPASRPVCDLDPTAPVAAKLDDQDRHGICIPSGGYTDVKSCRPDQEWNTTRNVCTCPTHGRLDLSHGGHRLSDGTIEVFHTPGGTGSANLDPGHYQVLVSRGPEYGIHRQFVHLRPGLTTRLTANLHRQVDTTGYISGDFHVHGPNSVDASATYKTRIRSMVAEGVEFFAATDHDYITDFAPKIFEEGLQGWIKSTPGMEVSPLDYGHFIGFPLKYDRTAEQNGGFHWRKSKDPAPTDNSEDFVNLPPGDIFDKLLEIGALSADKTVVFVAHFYDHFANYEMDPWTLELPFDPFTPVGKLFNTALKGDQFSGEFNAMEGFNGKGLDIIRRPTYKEVRDYNAKLAAMLKRSATWSDERRTRAWKQLTAETQREFIMRTPAEQKLAIDYKNPNFECRCALDSECGDNAVCDELTGGCVPTARSSRCSTKADCSAPLSAAGREDCKTMAASITGGTFCQRLDRSCAKDTDCVDVFGQDSAGKDITETCISGACGFACNRDSDCSSDPLRTVCDTTRGACVPMTPATAIDPCPLLRGTVDDWFQMLNRGMMRPFLGNSDTHGTYGVESGCPRNYVQSGTDLPLAISVEEIAVNIRAGKTFPTYGPFLDFSVEGKKMGAMVSVAKGSTVNLKLRVQSATWYDVDRIEIYKNGQLIKVVSGKDGCSPADDTCIQSPNRDVVNYDATFTDKADKDAWYVAVAMGVDGRTMAPVFSSKPVARLGMFELIQRLTPLLPPLVSFRVPLSPSMSTVRPYALTNPIWVDTDGDNKFEALAKQPNWATKKDKADTKTMSVTSTSSAASEQQEQSPAHSHDHRTGLGRMRLDARQFQQLIRDGKITKEALGKAINSLRYLD